MKHSLSAENPGIGGSDLPGVVQYIYVQVPILRCYILQVSYMEMYCQHVWDLRHDIQCCFDTELCRIRQVTCMEMHCQYAHDFRHAIIMF